MKNLLSSLKGIEKKIEKVPKKAIEPIHIDDLELSMIEAIDEVMMEDTIKWKQSDTFAPSSSNQCARYAVYRFRGYNQKVSFSGKTKRIFDLGNRVEDAVGDFFKKLGILTQEQVEVNSDRPPIKGYMDFEIDWDGLKPVECKSINDRGFLYRKTYHKPTDDHYRQLQSYLGVKDYESGFLFYYNKNDSDILPLLIKRDDKFLEKLFKKYDKIYEVHLAGNLPERPYKKTSANCKKCDAFDHCWTDTEVGVSIK